MEEEFGALYQKLIAYIEPDSERFRQGAHVILRLLRGMASPASAPAPLHFSQKCGIQGTERCTRSGKRNESGESI